MQKVFTFPIPIIVIGQILGGCELIIEKWQPRILICNDGNYLFYSHSNNYTYYTLMDKNGEIVMSGEVPLSVDCFFEAMIKAGYRLINENMAG